VTLADFGYAVQALWLDSFQNIKSFSFGQSFDFERT
jgi:hypothetical protein